MKEKKDETKMVIVTPRQLRLLKLGLKDRTKVRRGKEKERRQQYYK